MLFGRNKTTVADTCLVQYIIYCLLMTANLCLKKKKNFESRVKPCSSDTQYNIWCKFTYLYVTGNIEYWTMHTLLRQFEPRIEILIILIIITVQYFTNNLLIIYINKVIQPDYFSLTLRNVSLCNYLFIFEVQIARAGSNCSNNVYIVSNIYVHICLIHWIIKYEAKPYEKE
jgi:hypothetical protein